MVFPIDVQGEGKYPQGEMNKGDTRGGWLCPPRPRRPHAQSPRAPRPATPMETPPRTEAGGRHALARVRHTSGTCVQSPGWVWKRAARVRGGGEGSHALPAHFCICLKFHYRPHGQPGAEWERGGRRPPGCARDKVLAPGQPGAALGGREPGRSPCPRPGCRLPRGLQRPGHLRGGPASSGPRGTARSPPQPPVSLRRGPLVQRGTSSFRRTPPKR